MSNEYCHRYVLLAQFLISSLENFNFLWALYMFRIKTGCSLIDIDVIFPMQSSEFTKFFWTCSIAECSKTFSLWYKFCITHNANFFPKFHMIIWTCVGAAELQIFFLIKTDYSLIDFDVIFPIRSSKFKKSLWYKLCITMRFLFNSPVIIWTCAGAVHQLL